MSKKRARLRREQRKRQKKAREPAQSPAEGPLRADDVGGYRFFNKIRSLLHRLHPESEQQNRRLFYDDYAALMLFYYFNPIITSLRGMQMVSDMPKVREKLGIPRMSLGSLSESVRLFDPEPLSEIFEQLAAKAPQRPHDGRLDELDEVLTVVDGSILPALPRMAWALWLPENHNGVKLHLHLEVLKEAPVRADFTLGKEQDRTHFRGQLEANRLYVLDRGFYDYTLMQKIVDADSSFVMRLNRDAAYEVMEERQLSDQAREAGVVWDRIVRMGSSNKVRKKMSEPVHLIKIHVPAKEPRGLRYQTKKVYSKTKRRVKPGRAYDLLVATNLLELEPDLIGLIYRHRWKVEIFFRILKSLLGCRHFVSESPEGVAIQVYCALIAALLLAEHTGRRPNKRAYEIMTMYLAGWCTAQETIRLFEKYAPKAEKKEG